MALGFIAPKSIREYRRIVNEIALKHNCDPKYVNRTIRLYLYFVRMALPKGGKIKVPHLQFYSLNTEDARRSTKRLRATQKKYKRIYKYKKKKRLEKVLQLKTNTISLSKKTNNHKQIKNNMGLNPEKSATNSTPRPLIPSGRNVARNYAIIDMGHQHESYQGAPPEWKAKVMLIFEFPQFTHVFDEAKGKQPLVVSQEYTFIASDRSKLCKVLKAWGNLKEMPKKLNLKPYLGQYCEIKIEHVVSKKDATQTYSNIADGGRWVDAITAEQRANLPKGVNPNVFFDLDEFTWDAFGKIPKYIQDKIRKSREWADIIKKYPEPAQSGSSEQASFAVEEQPVGNGPVVHSDGSAPAF